MTNICNHRCPECVVSYKQLTDHTSLPKRFAGRIIDQLGDAGVGDLIFAGGGEPLCHPDTSDMVVRGKEKGMDVGFITNGQLINKEYAEKILMNCIWIRISLDVATPDVFLKTHGKNGSYFNKVVKNIKMFTRMKSQLRSSSIVGGDTSRVMTPKVI